MMSSKYIDGNPTKLNQIHQSWLPKAKWPKLKGVCFQQWESMRIISIEDSDIDRIISSSQANQQVNRCRCPSEAAESFYSKNAWPEH